MDKIKADELNYFYKYIKRKTKFVDLILKVKKHLCIDYFLKENPNFDISRDIHTFNSFLYKNVVDLRYYRKSKLERQERADKLENLFSKSKKPTLYHQRVDWAVDYILKQFELPEIFFNSVLWQLFGKEFDFRNSNYVDVICVHKKEFAEYYMKEMENFDSKNQDAHERELFSNHLDDMTEEYQQDLEDNYDFKMYFSRFTRKTEVISFIDKNWKKITTNQEKFKSGYTIAIGKNGKKKGQRSDFDYDVADIIYDNKDKEPKDIRALLWPIYKTKRRVPPQTKDIIKMRDYEIEQRES